MIEAGWLIALFQHMLDEHWAYELGAAREGCVDCSGAFVWAYKQLGESIEHGSNSIVHLRVGEYVPVSDAKPGYAVFKLRTWREDDSGNRWFQQQPGDCYHIGLMGYDGRVLNAQSTKTGFVASPASQNWAFAAPLKAVDYTDDKEKGDDPMWGNAVAKTQKPGSYVNLREGASTRAAVIGKVYDGERVNVLREAGTGWIYGQTQAGAEGYMSADYIVEDAPGGGDQGETGGEAPNTTTLRRSDGVYVTLAGKWTIVED